MDAVQWPPPDASLDEVVSDLGPLERALTGRGPAVCPAGPQTGLPGGTALVVGTSGSTGTPKLAVLSSSAVRASATATHEVLGGPGQWLLAMPATHVAGLQVLSRSLLAGHRPVAAAGSDPSSFADAVPRLGAARRYTSLVPTQLVRLLDDARATAAARELDAVLVGGAALAPAVRERARDAGLRIVRTYGMSETAGGCVYDGVPLPGVRVRVEGGSGVVLLGGPVVASGYHGMPTTAFSDEGGVRWFRTSDLGSLADGILTVHGRADDVIVTGGLKVSPAVVEAALLADPRVQQACVVGLPDAEWGQVVAAAVVLRAAPGTDADAVIRGADLPGHARPKRVLATTDLPLRGPGKIDREAVAALFRERS